MGFNRKWKPSKKAVAAWLENKAEIEQDFNLEISKIELKYKINIIVNKQSNSVYFSFKNKDYRISTHHSEIGEITGVNGSGYKLPEINRVTNSKKNIIKIIKEILEDL